MQRKSALPGEPLRSALFISSLLMTQGAPASTGMPNLEGLLEGGTYTSPSDRFTCDLSGFPEAEGFFINDVSEPDISDSLSFGFDDGSHYLIWTVRSQKEGRLDKSPVERNGFPVTDESFIPYFYSELPYDISSLDVVEDESGRMGFVEVNLDNQSQHHGYWVKQNQKWLDSIQFLPTLSSSSDGKLDLGDVEGKLRTVRQRCIFK